MYSENDLQPISALQHLIFCKRQCALIHLELIWAENRLTAEGRLMHTRVHEAGGEIRVDVAIERGLRIRSLRLGLSGIADVVEFRKADAGRLAAFPVEYKRGRPKMDSSDIVQLCAQAICLEEMLNLDVPHGALFYGKTKRRKDVVFEASLRRETEAAAASLHQLMDSGITPPAVYSKKCDACSIQEQCMPKATTGRRSVQRYLASALNDTGVTSFQTGVSR